PEDADVSALTALRLADRAPYTGEGAADEASVRSEVVGMASWTRRQLVVAPPEAVRPCGWVSVQDRAAGRTTVNLWPEADPRAVDDVAAALYGWAATQGRAIASLRGLERTRMDAAPFADDRVQRSWLEAAGFECRRRWLHMSRPIDATEVLPSLRTGVTVRRVH